MVSDQSSLAMEMASQLLEAVQTGEKTVDKKLIDMAENVLHAHQVYVQLLFVGMVVDQITQLTHYFDTMDQLVETVDIEDFAEATTSEKVRGIAALNQAIKVKVEVINTMMASKEAIGMLTSSMKDTFGDGEVSLEEGGASKTLLDRLKTLPAEQRQRVMTIAVNALRTSMTGDVNG